MYKSSTELIANELSKEVLTPIYKAFENANIIYKDIIKNEFFSSQYINNIQGRLISYAVQRQFDPIYLLNNFPFHVNSVGMPFKQRRVELIKDNILLTIGKSSGKGILPSSSKYKKDYSANNWGLSNQIEMDILNNSPTFKQGPYYGIISFGFNENDLDFVDLLIPDHKFESILETKELKPKFKIHKIEDIKNDEDRILNLNNIKREILKNNYSLSEGE